MNNNRIDPVIASGIDAPARPARTKYCKFCAALIPAEAVICTACGRQVEELKQAAAPVSVTVSNTNTNTIPDLGRKRCSKWAAFFLCLFLGWMGAHKFYEGRVGAGILYLFTVGLFGIGWMIDAVVLLFKSNPYYV